MPLITPFASCSGEIDTWVVIVFQAGFFTAALLALMALGTSITSRGGKGVSPWLGVPTVLVSLALLGFTYYQYRIHFVAVERDGTPASGPVWEALAWPATPLLILLMALLITAVKRCLAPARITAPA